MPAQHWARNSEKKGKKLWETYVKLISELTLKLFCETKISESEISNISREEINLRLLLLKLENILGILIKKTTY